VGPRRADAAPQAAILQDLVDTPAIVPMDPSPLEDVLRHTMNRGITVTTHEADSLQNTQLDLEAFDNI
jgi:simple sugar transport system substrate-binding protein